MTGDSYINKALDNGWLVSDSVVSPATTNAQEDLQIRMTLEPVRDLKIDLNAGRTRNKSNQIQFMYEGMPQIQSGNFNMTDQPCHQLSIVNSLGQSLIAHRLFLWLGHLH